jgi:hypothetical protein
MGIGVNKMVASVFGKLLCLLGFVPKMDAQTTVNFFVNKCIFLTPLYSV